MTHRLAFLALALFFRTTTAVGSDELSAATVRGWDEYVARTEERIEKELSDPERFLAMDFFTPAERAACQETLSRGGICISKRETRSAESKAIEVPGGMVHHWYGSILVPGVKLDRVLGWVRTYDHREDYYQDVEGSRLLSHDGDEYDIYLRLVRTKILTAHYDTEHHVVYTRYGPRRASSKSVATKIRELARPGSPNEAELPPGKDRGFLWRLNSYWRFEETEAGTIVECESVSLSRSAPAAVEWLARQFIDSVPRESLESALEPIRENVRP